MKLIYFLYGIRIKNFNEIKKKTKCEKRNDYLSQYILCFGLLTLGQFFRKQKYDKK